MKVYGLEITKSKGRFEYPDDILWKKREEAQEFIDIIVKEYEHVVEFKVKEYWVHMEKEKDK
jgi:hypothetical protein